MFYSFYDGNTFEPLCQIENDKTNEKYEMIFDIPLQPFELVGEIEIYRHRYPEKGIFEFLDYLRVSGYKIKMESVEEIAF